MSGLRRQSAILFLLLALVSLLSWGCAASAEETSTTATKVTGGLLPTTTTGPDDVGKSESEALIGTQIRATQDTPAEYVDAIKQGKPVVILFYTAAGIDDQKVLRSLTTLQSQFPDYAFLLYNVAEPDAYGDLSTLLKADYPPALVLVDATGTIEAVWTGYVDEGTLNQSLVDLGA